MTIDDSSFNDAIEDRWADSCLEDLGEADPNNIEEHAVLTVYANIDINRIVIYAQELAA